MAAVARPPRAEDPVELGVLGPLEVRRRGDPVDLPSGKVATLLAALAVRRSGISAVDQLVEALWPGRPPARPSSAVQTYVSRLRSMLGARRVVRDRGGYRLDLAPDEIDARRFELLVEVGRADLAADRAAAAATRLREALRMVRGDPYAEFTYEAFAEAEIRRLSQLRSQALLARIDADLALGRAAELVPELESLVAAQPTDEELARRLMLALYRSGSSAEALAVADRARAQLREQLGVAPHPATEELVSRILDHDTALANPGRIDVGATPMGLPAALRSECDTAFVGRVLERARVHSDATGLTLVVGEAGIGKTRLVAEVAREVAAEGVPVWYGRCTPSALWPYEPFVEAVRAELDHPHDDPVDLLADGAGELVRLVPGLAARTRSPAPSPVDADTARHLTCLAVEAVVRHRARHRGLMLVLDDLHWAGESTLAVLEHLSGVSIDGLRLVATAREHEPGTERLERFQDAHVGVLRLSGLDADEVATLARSFDPAAPTASTEVAELHRRSGGNPFYLREVLRARRSGIAESQAELTDDVTLVVRRRLAALTDAARAALEVGACLGVEFDLETLDAAGGVELLAGVDEASEAALVREAAVPGTVAFVHALVREVVLASLGPARRASIHHAIGEALELQHAHDEHRLVVVAHHLGRSASSSARRRAAGHATTAAAAALRAHDFEEAAQRCELALAIVADLDPPPRPLADLLVMHAVALRRGGRTTVAVEAAARAVAAARRAGDAGDLARALAERASSPRPEPDLAVELDDAVARLGPDDADLAAELAAHAVWHLATAAPRERVERARALAARTGHVPALARLAMHEWEFAPLERPLDERVADVASLAARAESGGDLARHADAQALLACALLEGGDLEGARRAIAAHERLAESRMPAIMALNAQRRAMQAILRGAWADAERHAEENLVLMGGDPAYGPIFLGHIVAVRRLQGRSEGLTSLIEADEVYRDSPLALAVRSVLHAEEGRLDLGRSLLTPLARSLDAMPRDLFWLTTMAVTAEAASFFDDRDLAATAYERLLPLRDRLVVFGSCAVCWGSVERFLAASASVLDRPELAVAHAERSLFVHERIGAVPYAAADRLTLARLLAGRPGEQRRVAELTAAGLAVAEELGMAPLLEAHRSYDPA